MKRCSFSASSWNAKFTDPLGTDSDSWGYFGDARGGGSMYTYKGTKNTIHYPIGVYYKVRCSPIGARSLTPCTSIGLPSWDEVGKHAP
jgi:hypothetical protein